MRQSSAKLDNSSEAISQSGFYSSGSDPLLYKPADSKAHIY